MQRTEWTVEGARRVRPRVRDRQGRRAPGASATAAASRASSPARGSIRSTASPCRCSRTPSTARRSVLAERRSVRARRPGRPTRRRRRAPTDLTPVHRTLRHAVGRVRRRRPRRPAVRRSTRRSTTRSPTAQRLEVVDADTLRIADGPGLRLARRALRLRARRRRARSSPCGAAAARRRCPTRRSGPRSPRATASARRPPPTPDRAIADASMSGCRCGVPARRDRDADRPAARPRARLDRRVCGRSCRPRVAAGARRCVAIGLRWRGSDLPAHFFRVALVERDGFEIWNNQWFGGHHTLGYGALFPVLGATFGIWTVAVLSAGAAGAPRRRADHARARTPLRAGVAVVRRRHGHQRRRSGGCRSPSGWPSASARSSPPRRRRPGR